MDTHATAQPTNFNNEGVKIGIQAGQYHVHGDSHVNQTQDPKGVKLPYAADALFNAYTKQHEPTCLPDTRIALLDEICYWIDGQDKRGVYWLYGLAGTGKSTIARTVARRYYEQKRLAASFFFDKGGSDVSHARKFATTVAIQLACNVPGMRQLIGGVAAKRSDISHLSLRDQWQLLVLDPLSEMEHSDAGPPLVLVIDALDECENEANVRTVIELLARVQALGGVKLRVFLTSRPEVAIRNGFDNAAETSHHRYVLHHIARSIVDADIELFLKYNLAICVQEQGLPAGWPGSAKVADMVQKASGLFIWAATAHRFIQQGRRFAARRLELILESDNDTQAEPEKHLNNIYIAVLRHSIRPEYAHEEKEEHCRMLRYILGSLVVLKYPLTAQSLGMLLDIAEELIRSVIEDLHAILDVPADRSRPLRLHHPSLRDFLLDARRCTDPDFWVDGAHIHGLLASRCLALLVHSFQNDIWRAKELRAEVIEDEAKDIPCPPYLKYACIYWGDHLVRSNNKLADDGQVHTFLREYFVQWKIYVDPSWACENIAALLVDKVLQDDAPRLFALLRMLSVFQ